MNIFDFLKYKNEGRKISMVTCYDYTFARLLNESDIDVLLVGDSAAMVMHGHPTTLPATVEMMKIHTQAVALGAKKKFIVADMPFLSFRKGIADSLENVRQLMSAGAHAVKLEGVFGHEKTVETITQSGVPVMGHIGLTPQSIHGLGGFRVQGREAEAHESLLKQARLLENLGCFSIVLECVPSELGREISSALKIPTIGIGAGPACDGQVLVLQDLLGLSGDFRPKFLRRYLDGAELVTESINHFVKDLQEGDFPSLEESYK